MRKKVAILVPNACDPDYRVIKQAEVFAAAGAEVRVFCRAKTGVPAIETINHVTYVRRPMLSTCLLFELPALVATGLLFVWSLIISPIGKRPEQDTGSLAAARARNLAMIKSLANKTDDGRSQ